ncbi:alpha,alpha-trehalose-phosphate synthase (UDP-forming) [Cumulibacter manganitolerans]|uniref:alpha,alpha-trehalose-phosphate synthase (UDP-forming) n=1 Tax=Cumulibacter manganitolerans TaxID=1884992 RepID=UPI001E3C7936|nr:trehalose-6-phosphate synthase [Cumulibacter manganitolerans]
MAHKSDFVVVANRLPVDRIVGGDGQTSWRRSPGGLVTAVEPLMRQREGNGAWVGWAGDASDGVDEPIAPFDNDGLTLYPVPLAAQEIEEYYEGFSNTSLWPLYHDAIVPAEYHRAWWNAYVAVNQRFADAAASVAAEGAFVWVHDYQLQLVPAMLRQKRPDLRIGFFLHIPFPPTELFGQLPWRRQILEGLLGADLVGFQTPGGAANFLRLTRDRLGLKPSGAAVQVDGRTVRARSYPISIDVSSFVELASMPEVQERARQIRHDLGDPRTVLLGIDRLDYTKGIGIRLEALEELLDEDRIDASDTVMIQVATPSRERVEQYRVLRENVERTVGRINGSYGAVGNPAVNYIHRSMPRDEIVALYLAADIMVVTPFRDGMNLVAKEYIACRLDGTGSLILSEFAGAARELKNAYLVNPYDIEGVKEVFLEAIEAPRAEQRRRMRSLQRQVTKHDVAHWAQTFVDDITRIRRENREGSR